LHLPAKEVGQRGRLAAIRYMHQVYPGEHLEQLAREVARGSVARRSHVDLARIGLGIGDEFGNRRRRKGGIDHHYVRHVHDRGDRRDVTNEDVTEPLIKRLVNGIIRPDREQGVTVRRCTHDSLSANGASSARPVLDDERLAEPVRQPVPDQAGDDVGRTAGGKSGDDAHRPRRMGLRVREA
jgi:hypothetical protein